MSDRDRCPGCYHHPLHCLCDIEIEDCAYCDQTAMHRCTECGKWFCIEHTGGTYPDAPEYWCSECLPTQDGFDDLVERDLQMGRPE